MSRAKPHYCHARHCSIVVRPNHLFCKKHWDLVPAAVRYRLQWFKKNVPDKQEYNQAALDAINAVEQAEKAARAATLQ